MPGVKGGVVTREAAWKHWSTLPSFSKCLFFHLFFNWSVLWRWELFSREAVFISTCKCPGMLVHEGAMGREREREKGPLGELSLINACHKTFGCLMFHLLFPDKTLIHSINNALHSFSPSFDTKDGHKWGTFCVSSCFYNEVVISLFSLRIGVASCGASLASVPVKEGGIVPAWWGES